MSSSRWNGSRDADIRSASAQPGLIGSGTSISAGSSDASTALVPTGRSTAAAMTRVATSTAIVRSARTGMPSAARTITSIGVESIRTCCSPVREASVAANAPGGRFAAVAG
jgi:hypothetical protein